MELETLTGGRSVSIDMPSHHPVRLRTPTTALQPLQKTDGTLLLDSVFNKQSYTQALTLLNGRIERLEEAKKMSCKTKWAAYCCRPFFGLSGILVLIYNALVNIGWDSKDPIIYLITVVAMVAMVILSGFTLFSSHNFRRTKQISHDQENDISENKKLRRFFLSTIAFCEDPNPDLFNALQAIHTQMPPEVQNLYKATWQLIQQRNAVLVALEQEESRTISAFPSERKTGEELEMKQAGSGSKSSPTPPSKSLEQLGQQSLEEEELAERASEERGALPTVSHDYAPSTSTVLGLLRENSGLFTSV